ncbi:MAG TPA: MT-A70 family methyltransferase [Stellaceae bacterium]|nr:MT-A70 family methyltransferase [Stellaceae bacterium]
MTDDLFDEIPRRRYAAIMADPPWHFRSRTALQSANWNSRRDAEKHYAVMDVGAICALPVRELSAREGAHLFLWTTGPFLRQAFDVLDAWGFRYSGVAFTWLKMKRRFDPAQIRMIPMTEGDLHVGLGLTTRKNTEYCLLGRRGNCRRSARDVREVIVAPVREHSRKPGEAFRRVERYCTGPYLELFARRLWPGWDGFGKEIGGYVGATPTQRRAA